MTFSSRGRRGQQPSFGEISPAVKKAIIAAVAVIVLFILAAVGKGIYTDLLWFGNLGYSSVYKTILVSKLSFFFIGAIVFFALFIGNIALARWLSRKIEGMVLLGEHWYGHIAALAAGIILALIFGAVAMGGWETGLRFLNAESFGIADPILGNDAGFYMFSLPFQSFVQAWFTGASIICFFGVLVFYGYRLDFRGLRDGVPSASKAHLSLLAVVVIGFVIWSYFLDMPQLFFSTRGMVFGAGYTDVHAQLPMIKGLIAIAGICAILIIFNMFRQGFIYAAYGLAGWLAIAIIVASAYPAIIQRFQVDPAELSKEEPYIEHNIDFTRDAFNLDDIEEKEFHIEDKVTAEAIQNNTATVENIRLWDYRPLRNTYEEKQSLRQYYDFSDIDVDRYTIDGEYQQVMLGVRELFSGSLTAKAQTWVNKHLQYTHGYGLVMSQASEVDSEGLPEFLLRDIPPQGALDLDMPQVYYGENTDMSVAVKTKAPEFDYPKGDENVYSEYEGDGGVGLGSFVRRLAYAWQLGDFNMLISGELTSESRVLYHRNIQDRIHRLAPFLKLDKDPYPVVNDGKLFWIQDAYTTAEKYPYSEPSSEGFNYIRNSVKVVVDAYNGSVTFYVTEPDDPVLNTYRGIFPDLFISIEKMPDSLRSHLRYPQGLFSIQAEMYRTYHMEDARVFYNKEDLWTTPNEFCYGKEQPMEPYYVIMRLPSESEEEFLLMQPFTPENKNNAIAWLGARCDGENYGELLVYDFPKDKLIYGPRQIENRIDQDTDISGQFTLWDQSGSEVIRGNLLMIPVGDSYLYVEPIFLQAEGGGLPELKRVIVSSGDHLFMRPTLEESLNELFALPADEGGEEEEPSPEPGPEPEPVGTEVKEVAKQAQEHYSKAQEYFQEGNWAAYGEELDALEEALDQLVEITGEEG